MIADVVPFVKKCDIMIGELVGAALAFMYNSDNNYVQLRFVRSRPKHTNHYRIFPKGLKLEKRNYLMKQYV